jgi:hypothetical protein
MALLDPVEVGSISRASFKSTLRLPKSLIQVLSSYIPVGCHSPIIDILQMTLWRLNLNLRSGLTQFVYTFIHSYSPFGFQIPSSPSTASTSFHYSNFPMISLISM